MPDPTPPAPGEGQHCEGCMTVRESVYICSACGNSGQVSEEPVLKCDGRIMPDAAAIRRDALVEAARIAWSMDDKSTDGSCGFEIARALRTLASAPPAAGGGE